MPTTTSNSLIVNGMNIFYVIAIFMSRKILHIIIKAHYPFVYLAVLEVSAIKVQQMVIQDFTRNSPHLTAFYKFEKIVK